MQVGTFVRTFLDKSGLPFVALVNNAGTAAYGPVELLPLETYRKGDFIMSG